MYVIDHKEYFFKITFLGKWNDLISHHENTPVRPLLTGSSTGFSAHPTLTSTSSSLPASFGILCIRETFRIIGVSSSRCRTTLGPRLSITVYGLGSYRVESLFWWFCCKTVLYHQPPPLRVLLSSWHQYKRPFSVSQWYRQGVHSVVQTRGKPMLGLPVVVL